MLPAAIASSIASHSEISVETPFYLRARLLDARTAHVHFELNREEVPRTCRTYRFTIRRNREQPYAMPEQNLTYWRNSLEMQHLPAGEYHVCATVCAEQSDEHNAGNGTEPITACVTFPIFRLHLLVFTLYVLVVLFLVISQVIFSLRKRQFHERIKLAMVEVEGSLQKWRSAQPPSASTDRTMSYNTLHQVLTIPTSPVDLCTPPVMQINDNEPHPIVFQLEPPSEVQA